MTTVTGGVRLILLPLVLSMGGRIEAPKEDTTSDLRRGVATWCFPTDSIVLEDAAQGLLGGRWVMAAVSTCSPYAVGWPMLAEVQGFRAAVEVSCNSKGASGFKRAVMGCVDGS